MQELNDFIRDYWPLLLPIASLVFGWICGGGFFIRR